MHSIELLHPDLPELLDELLRRQQWSWQMVEAGDARIEGRSVTFDHLQWFLLEGDPVLWGETNLVNRPEDGGGLWRYFDYQKPSLRFRSHVVHQDGAEVGKTREIITLALWGILGAQRGSVLIGSALDGDLDEIWEELEYQISRNPYLETQVVKKTTKPYRRISFRNGLKVLLRPAGHDGSAYRGIHVRGFLLHDEAAKVTNRRSFSEFWRAAKPGAEVRLYSVPTGDRLCTFQLIADNAIPSERVLPSVWDPRSIVESILGRRQRPAGEAARTVAADLGGRSWVRFHWPKSIMPAPFWSEERRQEFIAMYGGPDEPGYIHNVDGLPGDPEYSTFPARLLDPAVRYIPDYRTVSLLWDSRAYQLDVQVRRLNQAVSVETEGEAEVGDEEVEHAAPLPLVTEVRTSADVSTWHGLPPEGRRQRVAELIRPLLARPEGGHLTGGIDVASSTVTEIVVESSWGGIDTLKLRLHLRGWPWDFQRDLILSLDEILKPEGGWGLDATGAGKPLLDILLAEPAMRERLSGCIFNASVPAVSLETGEPQLDQNGRAVQIRTKELATQLLERDLSRRTKAIPRDPEVLHLFANHTYTDVGGQRRFSKQNDHLADAWRCAALRRFLVAFGELTTATPVVFAATSGRYDSAQIERDF